MIADKDLMPYNLSIVAILKNEGPYLKEWIDYHLLAGVDHFFLYDNDSTDNQKEVVKPYVKAGLVDYAPMAGEMSQMAAYNDAINRFKFFTRYMAFIDCDEFIVPKDNRSIVEVVDEVISGDIGMAGLVINWQCFGSSGHEKADLSKGVLERFTRRSPYDWGSKESGNAHVKTIANPRYVDYMEYPHFAKFIIDRYSVNEKGIGNVSPFNWPVTADKIVINHYYTKSREEFKMKVERGRADTNKKVHNLEDFERFDQNEVVDDYILQYRKDRAKLYKRPDIKWAYEKFLFNVSQVINTLKAEKEYIHDIETLLTCCVLCNYLKNKPDNFTIAKYYEEECVNIIVQKLRGSVGIADLILLLKTMPFLLRLTCPVAKDLRDTAISKIPQLAEVYRLNGLWRDYVEVNNVKELLRRC